jgi:glycosyltransferase involved in cell wall biosynthesis
MALLEAMAAGKPVVASSVGGIPSVIADDANGLLVNPGDPAGLVEALSRLLADAAVRRRLGGAARQTIEEGYSLGTSIRRLTTIYARFGVPAREASNG